MKFGLPELNKDNVMFILDKHVNILETMRDDFEEKAINGDTESINYVSQVMFALLCAKSIRAEIRELQEEHSMYSRNEIIEVLDEVNTQYGSNFKLKTMNIITTPNLGSLPDEDMCKLINLDACTSSSNYVFDVEDIIPILKKKVE
nr:MAG TPA: hypothetical protein [Caudoviricetes sp.]